MASASRDGGIALWSPITAGRPAAIIETTEVHSLSFSADGQLLAAGCGDDVIRVWEMTTQEIAMTLEGHR